MRAKPLLALMASLALIATACSTDTEVELDLPTASDAVHNLPDDASSGEKIAAALDAGDIDGPTAQLFRAWAQFGDPSLPEAFRGTSNGHDPGFFADLAENVDDLPDEVRDEVEPLLQRPHIAGSAFTHSQGTGDGPKPGAAATYSFITDSDEPQRCEIHWTSEAAASVPFRVWACLDDGEEAAQAKIADVIDALDTHVPEMIRDGLGAPLPDDPDAVGAGAGDDKIDIYVLPSGWLAPYRDLNERRMDDMAAAITMSAAPYEGDASSAYVLLGEYLLEHEEALAKTLVHEVFHVQQNAHYRLVTPETAWFNEASAVWAETYYLPETAEATFTGYLPLLQNSDTSLDDESFTNRYAAFLWFSYLEHEHGAEAVFDLWNDLGEAGGEATRDLIVNTIDDRFALEDYFPEFAYRLANLNLEGEAFHPRFVDYFEAFPDGLGPNFEANPFDADASIDASRIPSLGYRFDMLQFPSDEDGVPVTMRVEGGTGDAAPVVEALVHTIDERERVTLDDSETEFCARGDAFFIFSSPTITDADTSASIEVTTADDSVCEEPAPEPVPEPEEDPEEPADEPDPRDAGELEVAAATGDFCTDMPLFRDYMQEIVAGESLPVAGDVDALFELANPYKPNLPDGGIELVEYLESHTHALVAADADDIPALLADDAFQRYGGGIDFLIRYCDGEPGDV